MNFHGGYLGQRPFHSKVTVRTDRHTHVDRVFYLDH